MISPHYTQSIENIKNLGYCIIPKALNEDQVDYYLKEIKFLYEETKDNVSKDVPRLNNNQPNLYNIQNKSLNCLRMLLGNQEIEEILKYFLNDKFYKKIDQSNPNYILRAFGARSSNEALPLHIDSFIPYKGEECIAMQVAIMLEDSTVENGATLVIPKSHQSSKYADNKDYDKAIPLECKAGSILVWDSRLHHATTKNNTEGTRWSMIATFSRWFVKSMFNITESLPKEIYNQLTPKEKAILGFASIPPLNEYEGIDMKKGYDEL